MSTVSSFVISFIALCVFYSGVDCLKWKSCDASSTGTVKTVNVVGCETTDICVLRKGHNATFSVDFVINEDAAVADAVVHGIIEHIPVPFRLPNPDGCKNCGMTCPLKKGTEYTYQTYIYVSEAYPSIRLGVKWELQDQNKKDIFCIALAAEIQSTEGKDNRLRFVSGKL